MKKILALLFVAMIAFTGCKKDDAEPSFVDTYDVTLTEEKGTEHYGNFYPIAEGYYWSYYGSQQVDGEMKISSGGQSMTEPLDQSGSTYGTLYVLPAQSVSLSTGTYSLFPIQENGSISRYLEKTDDAVYTRAITSESGSIVEVKNPVFIKNPLVVGDSWEIEPTIDLDEMMSAADLSGMSMGSTDMTINCKLFVIGKENLAINGENIEAVRIDEAAEVDLSVPIEMSGASGTMSFNIEMTVILYLQENVGIVKQNLDMKMVVNGKISASGQSATIKITMDTDGVLELDYYDFSGDYGSFKNAIKVTDNNGIEINVEDNEMYQQMVNKSLEVLKAVKSSVY